MDLGGGCIHYGDQCQCRWEVIASFVNDHSSEDSRPKTAKQVLSSMASREVTV